MNKKNCLSKYLLLFFSIFISLFLTSVKRAEAAISPRTSTNYACFGSNCFEPVVEPTLTPKPIVTPTSTPKPTAIPTPTPRPTVIPTPTPEPTYSCQITPSNATIEAGENIALDATYSCSNCGSIFDSLVFNWFSPAGGSWLPDSIMGTHAVWVAPNTPGVYEPTAAVWGPEGSIFHWTIVSYCRSKITVVETPKVTPTPTPFILPTRIPTKMPIRRLTPVPTVTHSVSYIRAQGLLD